MTIQQQIDRLLATPVTPAETAALMDGMLAGVLTDVQIAAVLAAWRVRGEGTVELLAGARALRAQAQKVTLPAGTRPLADNCGTGGDGAGSFNVSTAAAIVAAAAGVRVAKHGNRSVSSKCGSADLLFAAGFPEALAPDRAAALLAATGFTFFFAPSYHPVLAKVAPVRKALGVRTLFNLLGPLASPIAPEIQLVGVGTRAYLRPVAETLAQLGVKRALVLHSRDGLDEASPAAPTDAWLVKNGALSEHLVEPAKVGVQGSLADLAGGDPATNLGLLNDLLGGGRMRVQDAVALNAGLLLWIADAAISPGDGVALARSVITSKKAGSFFAGWLAKAKELA